MAANIFTVCALVLAKPIFDILAAYPEFFVANHIRSNEIYLLTFVLIAAIPACLLIPVFASAVFGKPFRLSVQTEVMFLLVVVFTIRVTRGITPIQEGISDGYGQTPPLLMTKVVYVTRSA